MTINFHVYDAQSLKQLYEEELAKGNKPTYRGIIVDGVIKGNPRFRAIRKQKQELYDTNLNNEGRKPIETSQDFHARKVGEEFN